MSADTSEKADVQAKTVKSGEIQPISGQTAAFPLSDLRLFGRNPRKGNTGAIAASLQAHGQYRPVVANIGTYTGRAHEVLAGNHTVAAFRLLAKRHPEDPKWAAPLVHWVDVDEEQATRIVLADNRTAEYGGYDDTVRGQLLEDVSHDYAGLGFTEVDLARLLPNFADEIDPDAAMDLADALEDTGATLDKPPPRSNPKPQPEPPAPDLPPMPPPPLSFTVVFDDPFARGVWIKFLESLARSDPDSSPTERLVGYLEKFLSRQLQEDEQK